MSGRPTCIILLPFGRRSGPDGVAVDFDDLLLRVVRPAVEAAGLDLVDPHALEAGVAWAAALSELLTGADLAVADVTHANPNVLFELGMREAVRPGGTVLIACDGAALAPPLSTRQVILYPRPDPDLSEGSATTARVAITRALRALRETPSRHAGPEMWRALPHDRAEGFERIGGALTLKRALADARSARDPERLRAIEAEILQTPSTEAGVWADLFLSFRALACHADMVRLYDHLPSESRREPMIREQLAFALNRVGKRARAQALLEEVVAEVGPNPETLGILGRIHKDRWQDAVARGDDPSASEHLDEAIASYRAGFEADWRDAYPGINLVTLLELKGTTEAIAELSQVLPVVRYSAHRRLRARPDYWDHATLLELAVLAADADAARRHVNDAVATGPEPWQLETTRVQLENIRRAREARGATDGWLPFVLAALTEAAGQVLGG